MFDGQTPNYDGNNQYNQGNELVPSGNGPFSGPIPNRPPANTAPPPPSNGLQLIIDDVSLGISELNVSIKSVDLKVTNLRLTVSLQLDQLVQGLGGVVGQTVGGLGNTVGGVLGGGHQEPHPREVKYKN